MAKKRSSEEAAKIVVERLKESGNIQDFISSISDNVSWYGRFSRWPRIYFTQKVMEEMKNAKIIFLKENKKCLK